MPGPNPEFETTLKKIDQSSSPKMKKVSSKNKAALAVTNVPFQNAASREDGKSTTNSKPLLHGLFCLVDTINEDGIDATKANQSLLRDLGAQIAETLGESVTHFVCSGTSFRRNLKRVQAAELLDIPVVSPLWIEKCRESGTKVDEEDFLISRISQSANKSESAKNAPQKNVSLIEPVASKAASLHSVDSSFFCSSERKPPQKDNSFTTESQNVLRHSKRILTSDKTVLAHVNEEVDESEETTRKLYSKRKKISVPAVHSAEALTSEPTETQKGEMVHVPLPSFRKSVQQVDLDRMSNKLKRRRSERISDMLSDSSDTGDEESQSNNDTNSQYFQNFSSRQSRLNGAGSKSSSNGFSSPGRRKKSAKGSESSPEPKGSADLVTLEKDGEEDEELRIKPDTVLPIVFFDRDEKEIPIPDHSSHGKAKSRKGVTATKKNVVDDIATVESDKSRSLMQEGKTKGVGTERLSSGTKLSSDDGPSRKSSYSEPESKKNKQAQMQSTAVAPIKINKTKSTVVEAVKSIENRTVGPIIVREERQYQGQGAIFMLTGFDVVEGERRTIAEALRGFISNIYAVGKKTSKSKKSAARGTACSSSSSSSGPYACLLLDPSPAEVLEDDELSVANLMSFTHLIAAKSANSRTLRVLFAIARGLWILTEEWIYESICNNGWTSCESFRHPRYCQHRVSGEELKILAGKTFLIGKSTDPSPPVLKKLIEVAGGTVLTNTSAESGCDFLVMGNHADALEWRLGGYRSARREKSLKEEFIRDLVGRKAVVISKFIFNCIEATRLLEPSSLDLVSEEQLGWRGSSDKERNDITVKCKPVSKSAGSRAAASSTSSTTSTISSDPKNSEEATNNRSRSQPRAMRSITTEAVEEKVDMPTSPITRNSSKSALVRVRAAADKSINNAAAATGARARNISMGQQKAIVVCDATKDNSTARAENTLTSTPIVAKISGGKRKSRSSTDQLAEITVVDDKDDSSPPLLSPQLSEPVHRHTRSRTPRQDVSTHTACSSLQENSLSPYTLRASSARTSRMAAGSAEYDPNITLSLSAKSTTLGRTPSVRLSSGTASAPFSGKVSAIKGIGVSLVESPGIALNETVTGTALNDTVHTEDERSPVEKQIDRQRRSMSRSSNRDYPRGTMPMMTQCEDDSFIAGANRTNDTQQAASSLLMLQSSSSKKSSSRVDRTLSESEDDRPGGSSVQRNSRAQPHPRSNAPSAKDSDTLQQAAATKQSASSAASKKPRREFVDPYANYSKSAALSSSSSSKSMSPAPTSSATSFPATRQTLPLQQVSANTLSDRKYGRAAASASKLLRSNLFSDTDDEIDENSSLNNDTPTHRAPRRPSVPSKQTAGPSTASSASAIAVSRKASSSSHVSKGRLVKNGKGRDQGDLSDRDEF